MFSLKLLLMMLKSLEIFFFLIWLNSSSNMWYMYFLCRIFYRQNNIFPNWCSYKMWKIREFPPETLWRSCNFSHPRANMADVPRKSQRIAMLVHIRALVHSMDFEWGNELFSYLSQDVEILFPARFHREPQGIAIYTRRDENSSEKDSCIGR